MVHSECQLHLHGLHLIMYGYFEKFSVSSNMAKVGGTTTVHCSVANGIVPPFIQLINLDVPTLLMKFAAWSTR